MKTVGIRR